MPIENEKKRSYYWTLSNNESGQLNVSVLHHIYVFLTHCYSQSKFRAFQMQTTEQCEVSLLWSSSPNSRAQERQCNKRFMFAHDCSW